MFANILASGSCLPHLLQSCRPWTRAALQHERAQVEHGGDYLLEWGHSGIFFSPVDPTALFNADTACHHILHFLTFCHHSQPSLIEKKFPVALRSPMTPFFDVSIDAHTYLPLPEDTGAQMTAPPDAGRQKAQTATPEAKWREDKCVRGVTLCSCSLCSTLHRRAQLMTKTATSPLGMLRLIARWVFPVQSPVLCTPCDNLSGKALMSGTWMLALVQDHPMQGVFQRR